MHHKTRNGGYSYGSRNSGFGPRSTTIPNQKQPTTEDHNHNHITSRVPPKAMSTGLINPIAHGIAFGAGSQVAHQAVSGIMGPDYQSVYHHQLDAQMPNHYSHSHTQNQIAYDLPCMKQVNQFAQCIQENQADISNCQFFSSQLKECKSEAEKKRWHH